MKTNQHIMHKPRQEYFLNKLKGTKSMGIKLDIYIFHM